MSENVTGALVDLGNATYKAAQVASSHAVEATLKEVLGENFFEREGVTVVRHDDGLCLHFGEYAAIHLDAILAGRGPIVATKVRAFCELVAEEPTP